MTDVSTKTKEKSPADKAVQKKKKELRDLRSRIKQLREMNKSAVEERKQMEGRYAVLAAELGLPPKEKKVKTPA